MILFATEGLKCKLLELQSLHKNSAATNRSVLNFTKAAKLFKLTENTCQRGLYDAKAHGRTDSKNRNETVGNRHELLR